jgi:phosphatidylglycerol:prolipoprotein diacylglycerol transferase
VASSEAATVFARPVNIAENRASMLAYYLHDLNPVIFHIWGNFAARWYGLAYVLAFLSAYLLYYRLAKRGYADLPAEKVGDFIFLAAFVGVIVGGRIGYVLFYKPEMLREPWTILYVWEGGMSSHGGMIGLLAFTFYYARRHKISWTNLGDNLVVTAPIGLFFGRCANFINGELYGRIINQPIYERFLAGDASINVEQIAKLPWAMQFPKELLEPANDEVVTYAIRKCSGIDPSLNSAQAIVAAVHRQPQVKEALRTILPPRHPSQLYEAFFEGIVLFLILWFVRTRTRQPNGVLTGLFFICYAIFRIVVENFREPDATLIAGFTRGQFLSFFLIAIGLGFIVVAKKRPTFPKKLSEK